MPSNSEFVELISRGRGSQRAWEKATFPCPRTPTPSGFLAGQKNQRHMLIVVIAFDINYLFQGGSLRIVKGR